ncbi:type IV conjugative transfer system lipoprotein TraV [Idiomarina sp.]|uniref:type IV conjugative transfer system lipoprotein TraV n=1 Tax=Idiomarina sp. TaxID=1874361 RepID=UPI0025BB5305|nr:type IV conjugative transfer system lipoprotein TraV [Idiomarina sp.]
MNKLAVIPVMALVSTLLSGCMSPIGKEEFTCNAEKQGGACGGPREVYEMTNAAANLEEYQKMHGSHEGHDHPQPKSNKGIDLAPATGNKFAQYYGDDTVRYEPLDHEQNSESAYQKAKTVNPKPLPSGATDGFESWPNYGEPLAPEPLAVLEAPKVMRILVAPWTDDSGNLNLSSYVYVEVTPRKWSYGEAANKRPNRVVPLEIRKQTQEELRKQHERSQGVSPLEVMTPMRGGF